MIPPVRQAHRHRIDTALRASAFPLDQEECVPGSHLGDCSSDTARRLAGAATIYPVGAQVICRTHED